MYGLQFREACRLGIEVTKVVTSVSVPGGRCGHCVGHTGSRSGFSVASLTCLSVLVQKKTSDGDVIEWGFASCLGVLSLVLFGCIVAKMGAAGWRMWRSLGVSEFLWAQPRHGTASGDERLLVV